MQILLNGDEAVITLVEGLKAQGKLPPAWGRALVVTQVATSQGPAHGAIAGLVITLDPPAAPPPPSCACAGQKCTTCCSARVDGFPRRGQIPPWRPTPEAN